MLLFVVACSKDNNIVQRLAQEPAIVREVKGASNLFVFDLLNENNGLYSSYIVPSTALPAEYKQDGLYVVISGDVTSNSIAIDSYIADDDGNSITLNSRYNNFELTDISLYRGGDVAYKPCLCEEGKSPRLLWLYTAEELTEAYLVAPY